MMGQSLRTPALEFSARNTTSSSTGRRVLFGAIEHSVAVLDLESGDLSRRLETTFDAGGLRLALSDELDAVLAASYNEHGVALYCCKTGRELWRQRDLTKAQIITLSRDGLTAYLGREGASLALVDLGSGTITGQVRGARALFDSRYDDLQFMDATHPQLLNGNGRSKLSIDRTTFALLDVCFAPGVVVVSESGGPVRCIDVASGDERWRYVPTQGRHVLHLGYQEAEQCLLGVEWQYERGGAKRLIRWSRDRGAVIDSTVLGQPNDCCFGLAGRVLVLADGRIISTSSGKVE